MLARSRAQLRQGWAGRAYPGFRRGSACIRFRFYALALLPAPEVIINASPVRGSDCSPFLLAWGDAFLDAASADGMTGSRARSVFGPGNGCICRPILDLSTQKPPWKLACRRERRRRASCSPTSSRFPADDLDSALPKEVEDGRSRALKNARAIVERHG